MDPRHQQQIRSAWRPEFRRKVNSVDENATKPDFDHTTNDILAIPTHPDRSEEYSQRLLHCSGTSICSVGRKFDNGRSPQAQKGKPKSMVGDMHDSPNPTPQSVQYM